MKEQVLLTDLHAHQHQPDRNGVEKLADSIKAIGLVEPIIVAPDGDGFAIVAGHRRVEAVKGLGWESIDAIVLDGHGDEAETTLQLLASNMQRQDFTEMEIGQLTQTLFELEQPAALLSDVTGFTQKSLKAAARTWVKAEATGQAKEYLAFSLDEASTLLEVQDFEDLSAEVAKAVGTSAFAHVAARAKRDAETRRAEAKLTAELQAAGVTVIEQPSWSDENATGLHYLSTDETRHAGCPGHAAYVSTGYSGTLAHYVCTKAKEEHDWKGQPTSTHNEAEKAKAREGRQFKKDMVAPTEVRREWIKAQLKAGKQWKGLQQFLATMISRSNHDNSDLVFELTGMKRMPNPDSYYAILVPKDEKKAAKLLLAMVFSRMDEKCRLSQGIDHHQASDVPEYLGFLKKNGYVLSEHEEKFLVP